jgi:hypothetical protein
MTWIDTAIPLLRAIIQDVSTSPDYSTSRLIEVLYAAAHIVLSEIDFNYDYVINLVNRTITPDPSTNQDAAFINMTCYKAALFMLSSELKTAAINGIMIKDGPSVIDTRQFFVSQKTRYDLMLKEYDKVKMAIKLGDLNAGIAILSPFSKDNSPTYIWG